MPDFSFSPPPPDPTELIDKEDELPIPPPSQISSNYNPRKDYPRRKSEEERKMQKEEENPSNILSNINFNTMMSQMCAFLEKKYKLVEGLILIY
jgi:hypothetical protein